MKASNSSIDSGRGSATAFGGADGAGAAAGPGGGGGTGEEMPDAPVGEDWLPSLGSSVDEAMSSNRDVAASRLYDKISS
jgi:hypothetical protein